MMIIMMMMIRLETKRAADRKKLWKTPDEN